MSSGSQEQTTQGTQLSSRGSGTWPFHEAQKEETTTRWEETSPKQPSPMHDLPCNGKVLPGHARTRNNTSVPYGPELNVYLWAVTTAPAPRGISLEMKVNIPGQQSAPCSVAVPLWQGLLSQTGESAETESYNH